MTEDRHDAQIRNLVAELVSSAPPAPAFRQIVEQLERSGADLGRPARDGVTDAATPYVRETVDGRARRSKPWRLMAALVALGLASAGGLFAYGSLTADDGSASPEQAVKQFVDAFQASDAAGMLESLPSNERVVLRDSLDSLNSQGSRLRLTKDLELKSVSGVHLVVTGLKLSTTGLSEDVAAVTVQGTVRATANDSELPLGDAARDVLVDALPDRGYQGVADAVEKAINENTSGGKAIRLVTVKEGGGWHVSVWYTLAEYLRENVGAPLPNFGHSPIEPVGADSPEAVVRALLETSGDYSKAVALAAPDEGRVLYDYVPGLAATARGENFSHPPVSRVNKLTTHVEGDGDRRIVHLDTYELQWTTSFSDSEGTATPAPLTQVVTTLRFDGNCLTTTSKAMNPPPGSAQSPELPQTTTTCRTEALAKGTNELEWDMATTIEVTVERHDGRWFVSPVRSLVGETAARLALVPDGKAFTRLTSAKDRSSASLLLPIDLFQVALGSPYIGPWQLQVLTDSRTASGSSSIDSSSGPTPTTAIAPPSAPATTALQSATTAPPTPTSSAPATTGPAAGG